MKEIIKKEFPNVEDSGHEEPKGQMGLCKKIDLTKKMPRHSRSDLLNATKLDSKYELEFENGRI